MEIIRLLMIEELFAKPPKYVKSRLKYNGNPLEMQKAEHVNSSDKRGS
jgi:hypothetical protein